MTKKYYTNNEGVELRDFEIEAEDPRTPRELYRPLRRRLKNVFSWLSTNKMPETVYVVGAGPNGADFLPLIPGYAYTIACNSLIKFPRAWSWWVCFDHRAPWHDWFRAPRDPDTKQLFGCRLCNRLHDDKVLDTVRPDYFFDYLPNLVPGNFFRNEQIEYPNILRGGMTAGGICYQLARWGGAKKIVLVGLDFFGHGHWDGYENKSPHYAGVWGASKAPNSSWADVLTNYIRFCEKNHGIETVSLSETVLDVPVVTLDSLRS